MEDRIVSLFKGIEIEKREQINSLMAEWKSELSYNVKNNPDRDYDPLEYFASDGFFPGYFKQKPKVLIVGRESRYVAGDDIEDKIKSYKEDGHNGNAFNRVLLRIVQGIKSCGKLKYEELKKPDNFAKEMSDTKDYGFAFMNISKYSNYKDDGRKADSDFINMFLEDSNLEKRNFFREELEILDPDLIITMNLWDGKIEKKYLDLCFGKIEHESNDGIVEVLSITLNNKNVKLLNTYHFSAIKSPKDDFYDPLMKLIYG